ncbi:MAG: DUF2442 domain-containing protein [Bacteroidales bacterium]|jgi:hypothetical protein|nr:DUF2442 domain-containing protein [Bacteroidales bacterium]
MRIVVDYDENYVTETLSVVSGKYDKGYSINLVFSDGLRKTVSLAEFLSKSLHPDIRKYVDKKHFKNFKVIDGDLVWGDYDMIFSTEELYQM